MTGDLTLGPGAIRPLVRRLTGAPDPLAIYRMATDEAGAAPHTFLLESADRASHTGERSLIGVSAALHLVARPEGTTAFALNPNGVAALSWLATVLPNARPENGRALVVPRSEPRPVTDERDRFRQPSPLDLIRLVAWTPRLVSRPNPWCHVMAGGLSYDLIDCFERLPHGRPDPFDQPFLEFWLADRMIVVDHVRQVTTLIATAWGGPDYANRHHDASQALDRLVGVVRRAPLGSSLTPESDPAAESEEPVVDLDDEAYASVVARLQGNLAAGDAYQIVPSRTFSIPCPDPFASYVGLRRRNPSPYLFYFRGPDRVVFGASPETCLRVDGPTRTVSILPIAGTAPRGRHPDGRLDHDLDTRYEVALRLDAKEAAEHLMLVDLARNDVARISEPGTRAVTRLLEIERFAHVMHLGSEVTGTLARGIDALEAYAATMPMGTLVGAPKVRAAELLREAEPSRRGFYGGAVGYLLDDGTLETAIVIRSAVVQDGIARIRAGAGVVLDSVPLAEARETSRKARAVIEAVSMSPVGAPAHA